MATAKKGAGVTKGKKPAAEKRVPAPSGGGDGQKKKVRKETRAGLVFPISRIMRLMREGRYAERVGPRSAVCMAAVLEYLVAEVLEVAGNAAKDDRKMRITPRHLVMAIHNDDELSKLFSGVTIVQGGVNPSAVVNVGRHGKKKAATGGEE